MNLTKMTGSFQLCPCPAIPFLDMSSSMAERRYKRLVLPDHIPNEQHAKQLEDIEHSLWVLCDHFKVFSEKEEKEQQKPAEKPPEEDVVFEQELIEIMTALDPEQAIQKVVVKALSSDKDQLLNKLHVNQPAANLMNLFDIGRLAQIAQEAEQAQAKVPLSQFDHSYSVLTEIKTTIVTVGISEDATTTTIFRDQYGVPWQLRLRKDMEWLILDIDTSQCRGVVGLFKVLVRFIHESPLKSYPHNVPIDVNRNRTIYCNTLALVAQLREDGYFAADGTLKLRVAIIPIDPDAERSTLALGKRLKQIPANHNANRLPKFAEGQLTIPNFLNSRTTKSQPLVDAKGTEWQLEVRLNQGSNERERMYMAVSIDQCAGPELPDTCCHEYFVELLTVDADGWTLRKSGRIIARSVSMADFLLKSRAEIYLKDGKLRLRWGVRRIPIR